MWNNPLASRMTGIPTTSTVSLRRFMDLSNPQEHGMNALEISLFLMTSKLEKPILLYSLKLLQMICQIYVDDIIFGSTNKSTCEDADDAP